MDQNESQFAYKKPLYSPPAIKDVKEIKSKGPWETRSKAELRVLFSIPHDNLLKFLRYDQNELRQLPEDVRGLRSYSVTGIKKGNKGSTEFHRIRKELLFGLDGAFNIECEDVYGNKRDFRVSSNNGIYIPSFVLHNYESIEDGRLFAVVNTLFNPDDPRTHDTYSKEIFRKLQRQYI
jgi:mannose-6-phosphate isomerase-like protein (cupin superfamily)